MTEQSLCDLYDAIRAYMTPDGCTGGDPDPRTVEAVVGAIQTMVSVSNARPKEYAREPWTAQSVTTHLRHAHDHVMRALPIESYTDPERRVECWTSDLGQPEIGHALMRLALALHRHDHVVSK